MESEQDSVSVEKMMRRVRGLFAKAEGTDNEDEANVFRAKAYELLAKHNLDEMTVRASGQRTAEWARDDQMIVVRFDLPVRYREQRSTLLSAVMKPLHCKGVHFEGGATVRYIGIRRHLRRGQFLYSLLLPQMFSAAGRYVPEDPFDHAAVVRERSSFMAGFIAQVYLRLEAAEADAIRTAGDGAALAIRSDVERTAAAYARKWPLVRKSRSLAHPHSGAGFEAGIRSGNTADVGHTRVGGGRRALDS